MTWGKSSEVIEQLHFLMQAHGATWVDEQRLEHGAWRIWFYRDVEGFPDEPPELVWEAVITVAGSIEQDMAA